MLVVASTPPLYQPGNKGFLPIGKAYLAYPRVEVVALTRLGRWLCRREICVANRPRFGCYPYHSVYLSDARNNF
jgi:hypothetical protein